MMKIEGYVAVRPCGTPLDRSFSQNPEGPMHEVSGGPGVWPRFAEEGWRIVPATLTVGEDDA